MSVGGRFQTARANRVVVRALDRLSLELHDGDRMAIIGHNGAGKSTLLRTIAGVYEPQSGEVEIEGRVVALFDLNLGIDVEMTGYENIRMRGLMLGMDDQQITSIIPEIEEFTELADFLKVPVRTYSTGMMMRLAFAISTYVHPEILVMDEWLSTGDARFLHKAERRLNDVVDRAKILVLATHSIGFIKTVCNRAILLHQGRILTVGSPDEVAAEYAQLNNIPTDSALAGAA